MNHSHNLFSLAVRRLWMPFLAAVLALGCFTAAPNCALADEDAVVESSSGSGSSSKAGLIDINAAFGWQGMVVDKMDSGHGPMFSISVGYRFMDWLGVYFEQDLGGLIWANDDPIPDWKIFNGATLVGIRGFLDVSSIELWGRVAIGTIYTADSDGDAGDEAWFALRVGLGATYMFMEHLGAGLDFAYTLGAGDSKAHFNTHVHFISLKAHVAFLF